MVKVCFDLKAHVFHQPPRCRIAFRYNYRDALAFQLLKRVIKNDRQETPVDTRLLARYMADHIDAIVIFIQHARYYFAVFYATDGLASALSPSKTDSIRYPRADDISIGADHKMPPRV